MAVAEAASDPSSIERVVNSAVIAQSSSHRFETDPSDSRKRFIEIAHLTDNRYRD